ncbi:MAG: hypothetical protein ACOC1S_01025 [bacterium]
MLVFFKLLYVFGLVGILTQLLYQVGLFLTENFMQVLTPAEQAQLQVEKIFFVFTTPLFWILVACTLIGYIGTKKFKNSLEL